MNHLTGRASWIQVLAAWTLIALGAGQLVLIVATFSRLIDPGWPALGAIGTLSGLGVAAGCAAVATIGEPHHRTVFRTLSVASVVAGVVFAGMWLSLFGGIFWLNDLPRIGALVASDVVVAGWFLFAAWTLKRPRPQGFRSIGILLTTRAVFEVRYLAGLLTPGPPHHAGTSSGIDVIFVAGLVLVGYVLLAFWAIGLGRWMFGRLPRLASG